MAAKVHLGWQIHPAPAIRWNAADAIFHRLGANLLVVVKRTLRTRNVRKFAYCVANGPNRASTNVREVRMKATSHREQHESSTPLRDTEVCQVENVPRDRIARASEDPQKRAVPLVGFEAWHILHEYRLGPQLAHQTTKLCH